MAKWEKLWESFVEGGTANEVLRVSVEFEPEDIEGMHGEPESGGTMTPKEKVASGGVTEASQDFTGFGGGQPDAFTSPYRHGSVRYSGDPAEDAAGLSKLVRTGMNFVDIEPPKTRAEVDDMLTDLMAVFDDMFDILGRMQNGGGE